MYKIVFLRNLYIKPQCKYDEMFMGSYKYLKKNKENIYKFKKDFYNFLDNYLRTSGICNPEVHLGKGAQTAKTIINRLINNKIIKIIKE